MWEYLSCWRMLDGGEIARFLHLATRSRLVSTRKDASVIPPWNEAVSTKQPSKMRRNAMAASPSLKLVGHEEPDAGARSEPILAPRTRDQRTNESTRTTPVPMRTINHLRVISLERSCARFSSSVLWCCSLRDCFPPSSTCLGVVWTTFLGGVPRLKRRCL